MAQNPKNSQTSHCSTYFWGPGFKNFAYWGPCPQGLEPSGPEFGQRFEACVFLQLQPSICGPPAFTSRGLSLKAQKPCTFHNIGFQGG